MPYLVFFPLVIAGFVFVSFLDKKDLKENAEFEAKNCPHMLQIDSEYCKPIEDK